MTRTIQAVALVVSIAGTCLLAGQEPGKASSPDAGVVTKNTPKHQVHPGQLRRLDTDLTPVGAQRAGNADGSIPEWTGGLPRIAPIDPRIGYTDPFADDRRLYTITAANAVQYKDLLSVGHLTLLKRDARIFRMNVYPTRRSASYPDAVLAEVKKQAPLAYTEGYHIRDIGKSSVPFPIPADGLQVMWNHVFRWRGGSVERQFIQAPVAASGAFYIVRMRQTAAFDQHGYMADSRAGRFLNAHVFYLSPPSAIGLRAITWEPIDPVGEQRDRWMYVPQTLDTKRLPTYDYDQQELLAGGMRTADQNDGWNGAPDRYSWKLLGKKEMLIGYNAYKLIDRSLRYPDIIRARNLDPDLLRYEKHRVWVVEATAVKFHSFYRRIFYVDEDTWQVAMEEVYDKAGQLINFGDHHMVQFNDVQVPWYAVTIHHKIKTAGYVVNYLHNSEPFPMRWGFKPTMTEFLPSNIRVLGLQ